MSPRLQVLVVALAILLFVVAMRRVVARCGSGRLAQLAFRRAHGAEVVSLLDGRLDRAAGSPWIEVGLGGRRARMVAAPLLGRLQAGVELTEWSIPVQVWHTDGDPGELDVPAPIDLEHVLTLAAELAALEVDSLVSPALEAGAPHVLRMRFDEVAELRARFERVAGVLDRLEALAP